MVKVTSTTRDLFITKSKFQIKFGIGFLFVHSFFYWLGTYSFQLFILTIAGTSCITLATYLEMKYPSAGQTLKALIYGTFAPSLAISKPDYIIFAICAHFFTINMGFYDINLSKLHYLLISNGFAWILCYIYFRAQAIADYEGAREIKSVLEDSHTFSQILMCFAMNYGMTIFMGRNKYVETKVHENYKTTLLSLNKELEETNKKLQSTNADLQDALQEKENFILRFSHEIRNPLNSLLGNIELCSVQAQNHELEIMLQDARVSGEILLQLLNNVLDTAKVSAGRLEVSMNSLNFREFLQRAWVICSEIIHKKGLYGCFSVNVDVPDILDFDHHRIMQILINTISNAAKFTESGFVKVYVDFEICSEIDTEAMKPKHALFISGSAPGLSNSILYEEEMNENPENKYEYLTLSRRQFITGQKYFSERQRNSIAQTPYKFENFGFDQKEMGGASHRNSKTIKPENCQGYIRIEVIDSGCGIHKKDLDNLFSKFNQVNDNSSKRQVGTGLGLWITKEIIELMGGKIEIHSAPNRGTAIVIMVKSRSSAQTNALYPAAPKSKQSNLLNKPNMEPGIIKKVLVAEDILYNQEINRKFLQKCNVEEIVIANNGQEAIDIYQKMKPNYFDLILMDIDMPIMDGKTATKKIRQFEKEKGLAPIKIVFLTAYSEAKTRSELLDPQGEYRANGFISKPASLETVQRTLQEKSHRTQQDTAPSIILLPLSKTQSCGNPSDFRVKLNNKKMILVADDDPFNLAMVTKMVALCGFETLEARNGQVAIELYEKHWKNIKLTIMDCEMPEVDGWEATRRILLKYKKLADLTKNEIIIYGLTGHVGEEYRKKCLEAGMKGVLEKPIKIDELRTLLLDE